MENQQNADYKPELEHATKVYYCDSYTTITQITSNERIDADMNVEGESISIEASVFTKKEFRTSKGRDIGYLKEIDRGVD